MSNAQGQTLALPWNAAYAQWLDSVFLRLMANDRRVPLSAAVEAAEAVLKVSALLGCRFLLSDVQVIDSPLYAASSCWRDWHCTTADVKHLHLAQPELPVQTITVSASLSDLTGCPIECQPSNKEYSSDMGKDSEVHILLMLNNTC